MTETYEAVPTPVPDPNEPPPDLPRDETEGRDPDEAGDVAQEDFREGEQQ
jgi:hypothetical protein